MKRTTSNRTQLAQDYKVHYNTFIKWLKKIPGLKLSTKQRIFTPKQMQIIYDELGEPGMK